MLCLDRFADCSQTTCPSSRVPGKRFERNARTVQSGIFAAGSPRLRCPNAPVKTPDNCVSRCLTSFPGTREEGFGARKQGNGFTLVVELDCSRNTSPSSRVSGKRFERDARTVQSGIFPANRDPSTHHSNPSNFTASGNRSAQVGFISSIRRIFQARCQRFIRRSRAAAEVASSWASK
jgi:hypothetical protein